MKWRRILCRYFSLSLDQTLKSHKDLIGKRAIVIARCHEQDETKIGLRTQTELRLMGIEPILYNCREQIPTESTVNEAVQLANRTGMTSVIGVGPPSIIDLAKGTQYLLESRAPRFSSVSRPYSSNFKIPLLAIPTTPTSDSYQPSLLLNDLNSYSVSRYPLPNSPQSVALIPSLISEALSADPLLSKLTPSEIASMYYFSLIARYYDLFHSFFYLQQASELWKVLPSPLGQELWKFYELCQRCDAVGSLENIYSEFHRFNLHTASLSSSLYQLSASLSPKTNPTQIALMDSVLEISYFQQLKERFISLPEPFLRTIILNGTLTMTSSDDDSHEMRSLQESYRALCQWLHVQPHEFLLNDLGSFCQKASKLVRNEKKYWTPTVGGGSKKGSYSSQISFLVEDKIQRAEEQKTSEFVNSKSMKDEEEPYHLQQLKSDTFASLAEEILK